MHKNEKNKLIDIKIEIKFGDVARKHCQTSEDYIDKLTKKIKELNEFLRDHRSCEYYHVIEKDVYRKIKS